MALLLLSEPDMGLGLLLVSAIPGGGGGHLVVATSGGDVALSLLLNFTALVCTVGKLCVFLGKHIYSLILTL